MSYFTRHFHYAVRLCCKMSTCHFKAQNNRLRKLLSISVCKSGRWCLLKVCKQYFSTICTLFFQRYATVSEQVLYSSERPAFNSWTRNVNFNFFFVFFFFYTFASAYIQISSIHAKVIKHGTIRI